MNMHFLKSFGFWGKVFFVGIVILSGMLIYSYLGTDKLVLFLSIGVGLLFLEIRRQRLIDKAIKEISQQDNHELKEKIPQIEAKRSLITAFIYLIKKMGLGKKSGLKFTNSHELADLGPQWIKEHLGRMMSLYEILMPILLNSFLPPIKAVIYHNIQRRGIFMGASIGCGLARFEEKIARYCNKNKLPAVIISTDINEALILKAKKRMEKKKIMTGFQTGNSKIDIDKLSAQAQKVQQPLVYFVPASSEYFHTLFNSGFRLDLVWFLHSREHTIEEHPEVFEKIKQCTKDWAILETFRSWGVIIFGNLINWWSSPLFATETEISIARNYTPAEWVKRKSGVVIKRHPCFGWMLSKGGYTILKGSEFLGQWLWVKDKVLSTYVGGELLAQPVKVLNGPSK